MRYEAGAKELDRLALEFSPGTRHLIHGPHVVFDLTRRPSPIDAGDVTADLGRKRGLVMILGLGLNQSVFEQHQGLNQGLGSDLGQAQREVTRALMLVNRHLDAVEYRAGIHTLGHLHDADPGHLMPPRNRPVNRGSAAQFRKQRGVHVDGAMRRQLEHLGAQQMAIGHHHADVGVESAQFGHKVIATGSFGGQHLDTFGPRQLLDR